jgi:arginyl-tRNA synthetase
LCGDGFKKIIGHALAGMQADIKEDLQALGVTFDTWFTERSLSETGKIEQAFQLLEKNDQTYLKDGALWFKAQALGDDEDRVVRRDNGLTTYFASDIAYHLDKRLRGFDHLIDVWGADHHGYIARVKAGLSAMGQPPDSLEVVLLQLVNLYSSGQKLAMGKREGNFVTLRQLREEVGADACRFYYVARSHDQTLDFDLDLAKKRSNENPVFYIQYAHARIASFEKQLNARGLSYDATMGLKHLDVLSLSHERQLMAILSQFPEALALAARSRAPHTLVQYCRDLAHEFHLNYAKGNENPAFRMIVDDEHLRNARLTLAKATQQVLKNALDILGVSAPESM